MPFYQLRFLVDTCLSKSEDLSITFQGHTARLLFSQKTTEDKMVALLIETAAANHRAAHDQVANILIPTILDALSFATGTPLLLGERELILKNEAGSTTRRAIYVGHRRVPSQVPLTDQAIEEMRTILDNGNELRLPLCWHRYALDRQLALEQFVFHWLAFEALAGETDVASHCPICHAIVEHCEQPVTHRSSSKVTAREMFRSANPETSDQYFNDRVWGKARNSVFHGSAYPEATYLAELKMMAERLDKATDKKLAEILNLNQGERVHYNYGKLYRHFLLVEWETGNPAAGFATDCPVDQLRAMVAEPAPGPAHDAAATAGINLLDYQTQSPDW